MGKAEESRSSNKIRVKVRSTNPKGDVVRTDNSQVLLDLPPGLVYDDKIDYSSIPFIESSILMKNEHKLMAERKKPIFNCIKDQPKISGIPNISDTGIILPQLLVLTRTSKHYLLESLIWTIKERILTRLYRYYPGKTVITPYIVRLITLVSTIYVFSGNYGVVRRFLSCIYGGNPKGVFPIVKKEISKLTTQQVFSASLSLRGNRLLPYDELICDTSLTSLADESLRSEVLETTILRRLQLVDTRKYNEMYCRSIYIECLSSLWCIHQRESRQLLIRKVSLGKPMGLSFVEGSHIKT